MISRWAFVPQHFMESDILLRVDRTVNIFQKPFPQEGWPIVSTAFDVAHGAKLDNSGVRKGRGELLFDVSSR